MSYVRVLYDYVSDDPSMLNLKKNDIIQVLDQLPSGWWEGVCDGIKGFFPSNYIAIIQDDDDIVLPEIKTWVRQVTIEGTYFWNNIYTGETSWHNPYEPVDSLPTQLSCLNIDSPTELLSHYRDPELSTESALLPSPTSLSPPEQPLSTSFHSDLSNEYQNKTSHQDKNKLNPRGNHSISWDYFSSEITESIKTLMETIIQDDKSDYGAVVASLVESIRSMFYSSNTVHIDYVYLESNPLLRSYHKQLSLLLSKLVLNAQTASLTPLSSDSFDSISRMKITSNDILIVAQNFISCAKSAHVPISLNGNLPRSRENQPHLLFALEESALKSLDMIQKVNHIDNFHPLIVVNQVRTLVSELGAYLAISDDIPVLNESEISNKFKFDRLSLYNSISGLVMAIQNASNPAINPNASPVITQIVESSQTVERCLKQHLHSCKKLIKYMQVLEENDGDESHDSKNVRSVSMPAGAQIKTRFSTSEMNQGPKSAIPTLSETPSSTPTNPTHQYLSRQSRVGPKVSNEGPFLKEGNFWYLENGYDSLDLVMGTDGAIKGASLEALVSFITFHGRKDPELVRTFMITFRTFTTSTMLFKLLCSRFNIEPPSGLSQEEMKIWVERKQSPIKSNVCQIFKVWVDHYCINDEEDFQVLRDMRNFCTIIVSSQMNTIASILSQLIEKRLTSPDIFLWKPCLTKNGPSPILQKNFSLKRARPIDIDPLELARQLTVIEVQEFVKIQYYELLKKEWSKQNNSIAKNVKSMIQTSNQITLWVSWVILKESDIKKRAAIVKHFIQVADKCRLLNNFNSLMSILASLTSSPINRLKRTWDLINSKYLNLLEQLKTLSNPTKNFSSLREALKQTKGPTIPFLGIFLTDLTFIEDGNPNTLPTNTETHLINFWKRTKMSQVIKDIQNMQNIPYPITLVDEIQEYLSLSLRYVKDESDFYHLSIHLEPKEREDEKIARLLHESGFL